MHRSTHTTRSTQFRCGSNTLAQVGELHFLDGEAHLYWHGRDLPLALNSNIKGHLSRKAYFVAFHFNQLASQELVIISQHPFAPKSLALALCQCTEVLHCCIFAIVDNSCSCLCCFLGCFLFCHTPCLPQSACLLHKELMPKSNACCSLGSTELVLCASDPSYVQKWHSHFSSFKFQCSKFTLQPQDCLLVAT